MGFLQDVESIARRNGSPYVTLRELEGLKEKYDMDIDAFRPIRQKSRQGKVAVSDISRYFEEFSAPLFEPRKRRLLQPR